MHFCNRSNVGNLKPSQINCQKMQCKLIARGEEAVREGQLGTAAAVSRNVGWWPTRRMRDVRQGKGGGGWGVQKESTVTANECHCEHDATCALYGGQAMDAIATKPVPVRGMAGTEQRGEREKGGGVLVNGVWQLLRAMKRQNQIALQLIAHWLGRGGVHGSSTRAAGCTGQEQGERGVWG